jgi:hypothetical protein
MVSQTEKSQELKESHRHRMESILPNAFRTGHRNRWTYISRSGHCERVRTALSC